VPRRQKVHHHENAAKRPNRAALARRPSAAEGALKLSRADATYISANAEQHVGYDEEAYS
jgi:hypothetical protein